MLRRVFTVLSALSLLLCAAVVVLWVRSYFVADQVERNPLHPAGFTIQDQTYYDSARGRLTFRRNWRGAQPPVRNEDLAKWRGEWLAAYLRTPHNQRRTSQAIYSIRHGKPGPGPMQVPLYARGKLDGVGLAFGRSGLDTGFGNYGPMSIRREFVSVPYWLPALLAALLPAVWVAFFLRRRRRRARLRKGLCVACGYDLRAGGDRCPECGTPVVTGRPGVPQPGLGDPPAVAGQGR
jgi:hypothetical protein